MQIYTPMSPMGQRFSVQSLQKSNALPCKLRKIDCFILFPIEPEHEINLRGVPSDLVHVPGYFVNSLLVLTTYVIREGSGACAFAQSRKGLAAHYHKV